jgi:hypothetical protein
MYTLQNVKGADVMLNPLIIEAVVKVAKKDGGLFFQEFQHSIDPATTEWGTIAWQDSQDAVMEIDGDKDVFDEYDGYEGEDADPAEYWETYIDALVAETERLSGENDRCGR